jgi:hypothetical protein
MRRVLASTHNDRTEVEWPPHPSRLFSALVAAYEECDLGQDARSALEWLESLPGPAIHATPPKHGGEVRDSFGVFVPVNDNSELPERRPRQPRWFPAYAPQDCRVWFIWDVPSTAPFSRRLPSADRRERNLPRSLDVSGSCTSKRFGSGANPNSQCRWHHYVADTRNGAIATLRGNSLPTAEKCGDTTTARPVDAISVTDGQPP